MKKKGFTIIELMIVMAVIALLIGIAIPSFRAMQNQAKSARAQGDLRVIKLAEEDYYVKNNSFPAVDATMGQAALLASTNPVLETNLYDPFGATATTYYTYKLSTNGKYYVFYSVGSSGTGSITITDTGSLSATAGPIWVTNGR